MLSLATVNGNGITQNVDTTMKDFSIKTYVLEYLHSLSSSHSQARYGPMNVRAAPEGFLNYCMDNG